MLRGDAFCGDRMGRDFCAAVTIKPIQNSWVIKMHDSQEDCELPRQERCSQSKLPRANQLKG